MAYLSVKLDHIAVLREARGNKTPEPSRAAVLAELGGADGITIHLRRDRRHIRDRDLFILREVISTRMTVEIAPSEENISRLLEVKPYMVNFVPELDREVTTQNGLDIEENYELLEDATRRFQEIDTKVGLTINPTTDDVKKAARMHVDAVKIFTGGYGNARTEEEGLVELSRLERTAQAADKADLIVIMGQGLNYINLPPLARLGVADEYIIGQAIVARSIMTGMERAVREMANLAHHDATGAGY